MKGSFLQIGTVWVSSAGTEHKCPVKANQKTEWLEKPLDSTWSLGALLSFLNGCIHLLRDLGYLLCDSWDFTFWLSLFWNHGKRSNTSLVWVVSISRLNVAAVLLADHCLLSFFPTKVLRVRLHGPGLPTSLACGNSSDTVFAALPLRVHTSVYSAFNLYFDYRTIKVIELI